MQGLGYDDILLTPKYSTVSSRDKVDLSVELPKGFKFSSPIVAANMRSITSPALAEECLKQGALVLLDRFDTLDNQQNTFEYLADFNKVGVSVGVKPLDYIAVEHWASIGCKIITVDVAHGDHENCHKIVSYIHREYPDILIIAGNVCTTDGARRLWEAGADVVKVGVGPGSICTTRLMTGCGYPQFSAIEWIWQMKKDIELHYNRKLGVIADGGIRDPGDACKALTRADMVMMGRAFSFCKEANNNGIYEGSSTFKENYVEGIKKKVGNVTTVEKVYDHYHAGIRSCCSYLGSHNLDGIKEAAYVTVSASEQRRDRDK